MTSPTRIRVAEQLRSTIRAAFPKGEPPCANEISSSDWAEAQTLRKEFKGQEWWKISSSLIRRNCDRLPFFTATAYHYYLPAYLYYGLRPYNESNPVLEFAIYSLNPKFEGAIFIDEANTSIIEERKALFSGEERKIILDILTLLLNDPEMEIHHSDVLGALSFWQK